MIRDRRFYRVFLTLTASIALQNLLTYGVNLADSLMLGRYSQTALSGAALCNQIQFLLQMLVVGAGEGAVVLGARYRGEGTVAPIPHIIGCALRFGVGLALALFLAVLCCPGQILGLLTNDLAVIAEGTAYFRIICFTYVIFTATNILTASLRSIGVVRIGYLLPASTLCINVCLNSCLIYGRLGCPELGIRGAAVATLVSRCVELLIVLWYLKYREHTLRLTLKKLLLIDRSYLGDYVRVSLPVLLNQAQWGLAQMVQTGVLGHLGEAAIAANSVAVTVFQILSVGAYGAASAAGVVVGQSLGRGERDGLRPLVRTLELLFLAIGLVSGGLILLARGPILALYRLTPSARALAMRFMTILAVTTVGTAYQMACNTGIIRGGGDTAFSMKLNLVSMWLVVVPLSALAAFYWRLSPAVVFFLLKWDQLYKAVPVALRLHSWKWVKEVTRPHER